MYEAAVITISDRCAAGERDDESGAVAMALLEEKGFRVAARHIVPDDRRRIEDLLMRLCDAGKIALVLTTGGTGFAPRDVTPEATLAVVERLCPGIPEAMRSLGMAKTPRAMLSRAVAGIRGRALIVNLPGSPRAVRECLDFVVDELEHGLAVLRGKGDDCGEA